MISWSHESDSHGSGLWAGLQVDLGLDLDLWRGNSSLTFWKIDPLPVVATADSLLHYWDQDPPEAADEVLVADRLALQSLHRHHWMETG